MNDSIQQAYRKSFGVRSVLSALLVIVREHGLDHTAGKGDNGCVYAKVTGDRPTAVCIVGQWVAYIGYIGALVDYTSEVHNSQCDIGHGIWNLLDAVGVTVDNDAKQMLRYIQRVQDEGNTWGDALYHGLAQFKVTHPDVYAEEVSDYTLRNFYDGEKVTPFVSTFE